MNSGKLSYAVDFDNRSAPELPVSILVEQLVAERRLTSC